MMGDDPFSERDDSERTVIRPNPGGAGRLRSRPRGSRPPGP